MSNTCFLISKSYITCKAEYAGKKYIMTFFQESLARGCSERDIKKWLIAELALGKVATVICKEFSKNVAEVMHRCFRKCFIIKLALFRV